MESNIIILRKVRDFGERISDTLLFLKFNWKKLLVLYALFVVPFLLLGAVFGADSFNHFFSRLSAGNLNNPASLFSAGIGIAMLMFILATTSYATVVYVYMQLYDLNGRQPSVSEIGGLYFSKFLSNLGYSVVTVVGILMGVFVVIIPILGILAYFVGLIFIFVALSILYPVNTIEDNAFPDSFRRSFQLVRNRWWFTFGYVVILGIIFYFFSYTIQFIVMLVFGFSSINFLDPSKGSSGFSREFFLVLGLASILQQVFYLLIHVGLGVHYFSLAEEKDGAGLEKRLDQLGEHRHPDRDMDEQY